MKRFQKNFRYRLEGLDIQTLEESSDVIYGLSKDLRLIYFNPSWLTFAKNNNGNPENYPLGTPIQEVLQIKLLDYYSNKYQQVMTTGVPLPHNYECSSDVLFRLFTQNTHRLKNGIGVLIVNRLSLEIPFKKLNYPDNKPLESRYKEDTAFINQCSNCRCVQRVNNSDKWDRVSAWVKNIHPETNHTICPICYDHYTQE